MGCIKAEGILPIEIIELIQQYVDGKSIYPAQVVAQTGMGNRYTNETGTFEA